MVVDQALGCNRPDRVRLPPRQMPRFGVILRRYECINMADKHLTGIWFTHLHPA